MKKQKLKKKSEEKNKALIDLQNKCKELLPNMNQGKFSSCTIIKKVLENKNNLLTPNLTGTNICQFRSYNHQNIFKKTFNKESHDFLPYQTKFKGK